jgi:hypothetical protein
MTLTPEDAAKFITVDEAIRALEYIKSRGGTYILSVRSNHWICFVEGNQSMSERHPRGVVTVTNERGNLFQYDVRRVLAKPTEEPF